MMSFSSRRANRENSQLAKVVVAQDVFGRGAMRTSRLLRLVGQRSCHGKRGQQEQHDEG